MDPVRQPPVRVTIPGLWTAHTGFIFQETKKDSWKLRTRSETVKKWWRN